MKVSVIISTRNRSAQLTETLFSLERMEVPATLPWQLIVVDNGSEDDTAEILRQFKDDGRLPLTNLTDARRGKSYALNSGVRAASGEIIAFTDDDCIVAANWVATIATEFEDPSTAVIGGRVELHNPLDQPYTIRTSMARHVFSPDGYFPLGCNMAYRRDVLACIGDFDTTLGPGSKCCAAEDYDLLYRAYKHGFKILYVPEVLVFHNHGRRTEADVRRLYAGYGISAGAFYAKYLRRGDREILRLALRMVRTIVKDHGKRMLIRNGSNRPNQFRLRDLLSGARAQLDSDGTRQ